jgi:hypothetical protein
MLWWASRTIARTLPEWLPVGLALLFLTWAPLVFPQVDAMKTYKPFFQLAGSIVGHEKVIGNNLTETVEAFSPFYGGFLVETIPETEAFEQMVLSKAAPYALILPGKTDQGLLKILASQGKKVLETGGKGRRNTQLWRLSAQAASDVKEMP